MRTGTRIASLAIVVVSAALAACGGEASTDGAGETAAPLTREEWIRQENALCEELSAAVVPIVQRGEPDTPEEARAYFAELRELTEAFLERERALAAPPELAADAARFRAEGQRGLELMDGIVRALDDEDLDELDAILQEIEATGPASEARARELGLDECARDPFGDTLR